MSGNPCDPWRDLKEVFTATEGGAHGELQTCCISVFLEHLETESRSLKYFWQIKGDYAGLTFGKRSF